MTLCRILYILPIVITESLDVIRDPKFYVIVVLRGP